MVKGEIYINNLQENFDYNNPQSSKIKYFQMPQRVGRARQKWKTMFTFICICQNSSSFHRKFQQNEIQNT